MTIDELAKIVTDIQITNASEWSEVKTKIETICREIKEVKETLKSMDGQCDSRHKDVDDAMKQIGKDVEVMKTKASGIAGIISIVFGSISSAVAYLLIKH